MATRRKKGPRVDARRAAGAATGCVWVALATASLLLADQSWQSKPPAQWTQEEAEEALTDSPWARGVTIYHPTGRILGVLPGGRKVVVQDGSNLPPRTYSVNPVVLEPELWRGVYVVRWDSAGIVQQGLARLREIANVLADVHAPPPEVREDAVVITVRVLQPPEPSGFDQLDRPTILDESGRPVREEEISTPDLLSPLSEDELKVAAELRLPDGRWLKPERAVKHGLGTSAGFSFYFPRAEKGRGKLPSAGEVEFFFQHEKEERLRAKFKLSEMVAGGKRDY